MKKNKQFCRVRLEPELEEIAALWPAAKRFEVALKLTRWSRQLRVSARIMIFDTSPAARRRALPVLPLPKAAQN